LGSPQHANRKTRQPREADTTPGWNGRLVVHCRWLLDDSGGFRGHVLGAEMKRPGGFLRLDICVALSAGAAKPNDLALTIEDESEVISLGERGNEVMSSLRRLARAERNAEVSRKRHPHSSHTSGPRRSMTAAVPAVL